MAQDARSAEIIKPVLRGKDIRRYRAKWAGMWLIDTHNGYDGVTPIDIGNYPAIMAHLDTWWERLKKRYDKGKTPYNLRNCAYHGDFEKEKLVWIELVDRGRFAYDNTGLYGEATTFLLTGECIKYLCAVLNTKLIGWYLGKTAPTSGMGTLRWKKVYVERIPIPKIGASDQERFMQLIDDILESRKTDAHRDVSTIEEKLDETVYELYDLTPSEISAIEKNL